VLYLVFGKTTAPATTVAAVAWPANEARSMHPRAEDDGIVGKRLAIPTTFEEWAD